MAASTSAARQRKIPKEVLSTLLHPDVRLRDLADKLSRLDDSVPSLRITKVQPAGDVVHVFSHIKKTYRVQWVVVEGTKHPPQLPSATDLPTTPKSASKSRKKPKKPEEDATIPCSTWVPLDAVAAKK